MQILSLFLSSRLNLRTTKNKPICTKSDRAEKFLSHMVQSKNMLLNFYGFLFDGVVFISRKTEHLNDVCSASHKLQLLLESSSLLVVWFTNMYKLSGVWEGFYTPL